MAEQLEVSTKTIQRDLEFMRDRLGLPIEFSAAKNGYFYAAPVTHFPSITVSEGELVALFVAQKALELYQGTAYEQQLASAFRKLTDGLQEQVSFSWSELDHAISFRGVGTTAPDLVAFQEVSRAVLRSRQLVFEYRKIRGAGYERRRMEPYHLGCIKNQWYAIGRDLDRQKLRTFALVRMRKVKSTAVSFQRPADFSIGEHLRQSFGVMAGEGATYQVRLRFDAFAGQMVSERQWHASQRLKPLAKGGVELTLELGSLEEVKRWVLSWGAHVRVLAPKELVAYVRQTLASVARLYRA